MSSLRNSSVLLSSFDETNGRGISHAANQSVRPYSTNQEYLFAMREDLADWLKSLYDVNIDSFNFFDVLQTGTLLCQHANNITTCADYIQKNNIKVHWKYVTKFPSKLLVYNQGKYVRASSFFARDNIASFIGWCRSELDVPDIVMFETNDLVLRYNEKNVILCLLEVARRGSRFGVPAPMLVQMEEEIDEEIEMDKVAKERNEPPKKPAKQRVTCDFKSLDEMVQFILGQCTCPSQFPMVKVSDGKYKVGDSENLIFMRILRQHVMVRVGGGWDTLEHYLNKHDPCRCQKHKNDKILTPRHSRSQNASVQQPTHQQNRIPLTSTGTLVKTTPRNKQLRSSARLTRSTNNLTELSLFGRSDKNLTLEKKTSQSRHSSTSDTSASDVRPSTSRRSNAPERNVNRNSTSNKERLSVQPDVFSRLSRPKSTPPISKETSVFQDDRLLIQRNKKGSHQVHRTSAPGNQPKRQSQTERTRTKSSDRSNLRSKSSTAFTPSNRTDEPRWHVRNPNQRRSEPIDQRKTQTPRRSVAKKPSPRTPTRTRMSSREESEDREKEILQAFEKECIANQYSLQHSQLTRSRSRQSSTDSLLEPSKTTSFTSQEDSEVALHMSATDERSGRPSHPPDTYYSLPRPRKDKRDLHDRRTRIPTPVSFNKPQMSTRSIDINNKKEQVRLRPQSASLTVDVNGSDAKTEDKACLVNGDNLDSPTSPPVDLRHPRTAFPFDKLNQFLSRNNKLKTENDRQLLTKSVSMDHPSHYLDQGYLRSSRDEDNLHATQPAFSPIENNFPDSTSLKTANYSDRHGSPRSRHPPSAFPDNLRFRGPPFEGQLDLNRNYAGYHGNMKNMNAKWPAHVVPSNGVVPKPSQNGLPMRPSSTNKSREPQWV